MNQKQQRVIQMLRDNPKRDIYRIVPPAVVEELYTVSYPGEDRIYLNRDEIEEMVTAGVLEGKYPGKIKGCYVLTQQ